MHRAITLAELRLGAERRNSQKLDRLIAAFIADIAVALFDDACAITFGRVAGRHFSRVAALETVNWF